MVAQEVEDGSTAERGEPVHVRSGTLKIVLGLEFYGFKARLSYDFSPIHVFSTRTSGSLYYRVYFQ